MKEECTVLHIKNELAFVSLAQKSKCGGCKACVFGKGKVVVPAIMDVECKQGDNVLVEMPQKDVPTAALLIYLIPLLMLVVGFTVGGLIGGDITRVVCAFIFTAASIVPCIYLDRIYRTKREYMPIVTQVLEKKDGQTED